MVGVGAKVLGNITLGDNSKVGGGAVVVKDVPADCTVVGVPGHVVRIDGKRPADCAAPVPAELARRLERERDSFEDSQHRQKLPDPMSDEIAALTAQVAELSRKVAELQSKPEE